MRHILDGLLKSVAQLLTEAARRPVDQGAAIRRAHEISVIIRSFA